MADSITKLPDSS